MKTYPDAAEEKLGFGALRERLGRYTLGPLGQERVANMRPHSRLDRVQRELDRVAEMQVAFRYDDSVPLNQALDVRPVLRKAAPKGAYVEPEKLLAVRRVLVTLRRLKRYVEKRREDYPRLHESAGRVTPLQDVEDHIADVVDEGGAVRDDASPTLRQLRRQIDRKQAQLRETLRRELHHALSEGHAAEDQPTLRSGRMVIPVRASAKRKVEGVVQDVSASGQTVYIEPTACLEINNEVRELEAEARREVERILREVTSRLRQHMDALRENVRALGQFDLLQAKARLANELDAVAPALNEDGAIDIRGGRNPLLLLHFRRLAKENDSEPREVVPLELAMDEAQRTLVITGPNAGGKTVAMKTVGLFTLMLACGLPIPVAPESRFSLFEQLIIDIGDEQSIEEDLSTFSSHVANLKYMLTEAGGRALILIDEAGTGTDPEEGGALAQAVLERLTDVGARTIATTHHGTLKTFAHETPGIENGSMEFDQATLSPTYRFRIGVPGSSYAFEIAERLGLSEETLARARELVGRQKTAMEELISTFETRTQELERQLDEAQAARRQAEQERETFEGRLRKLKKERDEIRQQALEEAERIVQGANARIERTIREIKEAGAEREATQKARADLETYKENIEAEHGAAEARQREQQEADAAQEESPSANGSPEPVAGPIQEGDQVVIDEGTTKGEVLELDDDEAVIRLGAMRMRAALDRLTKVGGSRKQQVTVQSQRSSEGNGVEAELDTLSARLKVDLRGQRVGEARKEVERLLDEALAADLRRVEVLHGKGTGALRKAIHEYLAGQPEVDRFEEAPWNEGGSGVTYVYLK